ncbi:AAA family ATPase [Fortiea sp. LEGE XX443]|uniref:trifunctional serine/threonine-protein kinase/ATP-binding protein/sensor histidine kinase n=1 Tax=Fortiea sp. LEGE XX443 TaxID=1828611 RepID=UPI0018816491|nr:ATP-binding sensor histidine kinase [Fortiea sp. LEGE XX443]MBE9007290.1 AAA family ATPase [Fortiea sp. LEGE XX443]
MLTLSGYRVNELIYSGSNTLVHRGIRELDQQPVIIKLLRRDYPTFHELVRFRNQYTITKNLDIDGIVKTYSLETYQNSYALVMEDLGAISLQEYTAKYTLNLSSFFNIAIQIVSILGRLYRHRVIHKDIKPANILINPSTKEVKLIDFSIASLLKRETQSLTSPNILEGTLAYLSPEQTGRTNRAIDYRSDFYSLGVTFFELLTGKLPFCCQDAMELVYCHLAKMPPKVESLNPEIPSMVSDIISKLMAKNAEDRYQSALGLKYDLEMCQRQWQKTGTVKDFRLGVRDICDRFQIPEKLYGRQTEVKTLLAAFERVAKGNTEMMLVAGFSGIGKTAVVKEVHKPIVRQRGYFIQGKYDQFQRNIPFSAFVQAFRDLIEQLLSESDTQLQHWQSQIMQALGENAQVIIDVIPELEKIIGQQPPVPELSGNAAQNRFDLLLHRFIKVFTTKDHPLVIFLDDLQWADSASLKLIKLLISNADTGYLLLIGAYRNNEVSTTHPLMLTLAEIKKNDIEINKINLDTLQQTDLNYLIADTLNCSLEVAFLLTKFVYQKTRGNPLFTHQFLRFLHEEKLISFNFDAGYWQCDIAQVKALALTDDIVEFLATQLQKLPSATLEVLKLAACIGNQFDLGNLAIVYEKSLLETANDLWKALQEELIIPTSEVYKFFHDHEELIASEWEFCQSPTYRFLHDRVQQAAYFLIPEEQKKSTHLKIGQILLKNTPNIEENENLFSIVNQLNMGADLITDKVEKNKLAQLNLSAGNKAKSATAYETAVKYLNTALALLEADSWQEQYDLTLKLYIETAESEYLNINFARAIELTEIALQNTKTLVEQVKVYELQMQICIAQLQMVQAVEIGLQILEKLEIPLVNLTSDESLVVELPELSDIDNFLVMTDPDKLAAMEILKILCAPVFMAKPEIFPQVIITMVNLCLEHGNSKLSAFAYCFYGLLLSGIGQLTGGYNAGNIALKLLDKFAAKELKAKVYNLYNSNIRTWKEHAKHSVQPLQEAVQSGLETGDIEWGGYSAANLCSYLFFSGNNLESAVTQQANYIDICIKIKQEIPIHFSQIWRQLGLNLQGLSPDKYLLVGESFNELQIIPHLIVAKSGTVLFIFYVAKTILLYQFRDYAQAIKQVKLANEQAGSAFGFMQVVILNFYHSLALLANYFQADIKEKQKYLEQVEANQERMKFWAENAPMNNQHRYNLVEAEKLRVLGRYWQAAELYDRAIAQAKENEYIQEEALIHEIAAQFYLEWDREQIAQIYLTNAYYCYALWGAKAKIEDLEQRYSNLLAPILQWEKINFNPKDTFSNISRITRSTFSSATTDSSSNSSISQALDLDTVLKASQAVSSEIEQDKLLTTLMQVLMENVGAEKAVLILLKENIWVIEAIATVNKLPNILQSIPIELSQDVPQTVINYVKHTGTSLVIDNATQENNFAADAYIIYHKPKSLLCTPILHQGKLIGILYLENNLMLKAFTSDRLTIIKLLCSQAAISLENARLYQQSQDDSQKLSQSLTELQQMQLQLIQSEKMSALGNLVAGVAHEINNPVGFIAGNIQPAVELVEDLFHILDLYQQKFPEPGEEIAEEIAAVDLEYLREDLPKLISSMKLGVDRIRKISAGLRTFSRLDTEYKTAYNLHEGIDSTILILKHRLKPSENRPEINVVKNYGDIPQVECFPGQLNQVFMNLLANAIDALEESNIGRQFYEIALQPNQIVIQTSLSDDKSQVVIQIIDNGMGIPDDVKNKIFDHLFTTKSVGKGTGLGLAIARQIIVEKHSGILEVNSVQGEGSEFIIKLPI